MILLQAVDVNSNNVGHLLLGYPQNHMHGGGPPTLQCVSKDDAFKRYGIGGNR